MNAVVTVQPAVGLPVRFTGTVPYDYLQYAFTNDFYDLPANTGAYTNGQHQTFGFWDFSAFTRQVLPGPPATGGVTVADVVAPNGTLSTPAPTAAEPMSASVTVPTGGAVSITIAPDVGTTSDTTTYDVAGRVIRITSPDGSAAAPLEVRFRVDSSVAGYSASSSVQRNGVWLAPCDPAATSWPIACVVSITHLPDGDTEWVVRTPAASEWRVLDPVAPERDEPASVTGLSAARNGSNVTVTWTPPATPGASLLVSVPGTSVAALVRPGDPASVVLANAAGGATVEVTTVLADGRQSARPVVATITGEVDATPPSITCAANVSFTFRSTGRTLTASVSDGGSGVASPTVSVSAATTTAGLRTVSVTATDLAGNAATVSCQYRVVYKVDWLLPVGGPGQVRSVIRNTVVPFTFRLTDASGNPVTGAVVSPPTSTGVACPSGSKPLVVSLPGQASTTALPNGWRLAGWKANASWRGTCRVVSIALADGTTLTSTFSVI